MTTAQLTKTTSVPNYNVTTMQTALSTLVAAMNAGQQINAADVVTLKTATYDVWRTHYHTAVDTIGIDGAGATTTYGPAPGQTTTTTSSASLTGAGPTGGSALGAVTTPANITSGHTIDAADINTIINTINSMAVHYHTMADQIGTAGLPVANLGSSAFTVQSANGAAFGTSGGPLDATLIFNSNGTLQSRTQDPTYGYYYYTYPNMWINHGPLAGGAAASYEIQVVLDSQDTDVGTVFGTYDGSFPLSSWTNMGSGGTVSVSFTGGPHGGAVASTATGWWHLTVSIRPAGGGATLATQTVNLGCAFLPPFEGGCCFPAGAQVLMGDNTWKAIEAVEAGDVVMGMGKTEVITEVSRPILGRRKLVTFSDRSLTWSDEHAFWTKDAFDTQWWWSANAQQWKLEAAHGVMGGLKNNDSLRTGRNVSGWAHLDGWKANVVQVIPDAAADLQLYLPRTTGSPIIVNGYVVGAGVNQDGYDYTTLDWNVVQASMQAAPPIPTV